MDGESVTQALRCDTFESLRVTEGGPMDGESVTQALRPVFQLELIAGEKLETFSGSGHCQGSESSKKNNRKIQGEKEVH